MELNFQVPKTFSSTAGNWWMQIVNVNKKKQLETLNVCWKRLSNQVDFCVQSKDVAKHAIQEHAIPQPTCLLRFKAVAKRKSY